MMRNKKFRKSKLEKAIDREMKNINETLAPMTPQYRGAYLEGYKDALQFASRFAPSPVKTETLVDSVSGENETKT